MPVLDKLSLYTKFLYDKNKLYLLNLFNSKVQGEKESLKSTKGIKSPCSVICGLTKYVFGNISLWIQVCGSERDVHDGWVVGGEGKEWQLRIRLEPS